MFVSRRIARAAAGAVLGLMLGCVPRQAVDAARIPEPEIADPLVREFVERVNAHRRRIHCRPLTWDARIAAVAQRHSRDMAGRRYFSHKDPNGRTPFDRLERASISYRKAAENIAFDDRDPEDVLRAWLASRGHRANLEDCDYTRHGVGRFEDYWTHVFVRPSQR